MGHAVTAYLLIARKAKIDPDAAIDVQRVLWTSRADADLRVGGSAVDAVNRAEHERVALCDLSICADGRGVSEIVRADIRARPYDRVVAATDIGRSGFASEEDIGRARVVRISGLKTEERILVTKRISLSGGRAEEGIVTGSVKKSSAGSEEGIVACVSVKDACSAAEKRIVAARAAEPTGRGTKE